MLRFDLRYRALMWVTAALIGSILPNDIAAAPAAQQKNTPDLLLTTTGVRPARDVYGKTSSDLAGLEHAGVYIDTAIVNRSTTRTHHLLSGTGRVACIFASAKIEQEERLRKLTTGDGLRRRCGEAPFDRPIELRPGERLDVSVLVHIPISAPGRLSVQVYFTETSVVKASDAPGKQPITYRVLSSELREFDVSDTDISLPVLSRVTSEEVQEVINKGLRPLKSQCWWPAVAKRLPNAPPHARVFVHITTDELGGVKELTADTSTPGYPTLADCLLNRVRKWKFPAYRQSTQVNVPIVFAIRDGAR